VSCSSSGVGASVQLTTEESRALEHPSSGSWRRMLFKNSRNFFLSFQLGLKIKEFIGNAFGGFSPGAGFPPKIFVHPGFFYLLLLFHKQ